MRLTEEQVLEVPELLNQGVSISAIARKFGVSGSSIRRIIAEKVWLRGGKPDRCPDCGGLVLDDSRPCLKCETDANKSRRRAWDEFRKVA